MAAAETRLGKPYTVRGKVYYPKEVKDYEKTGMASWYGDAFHGRLTANGEIYDMTHLTAAHPTMPLPSYARVTNTANRQFGDRARQRPRPLFAQPADRPVEARRRTARLQRTPAPPR